MFILGFVLAAAGAAIALASGKLINRNFTLPQAGANKEVRGNKTIGCTIN